MHSRRRQPLAQSQRAEQTDAVAVELSEEDALPLLQRSEITSARQIPWSSNYSFLVRIDAGPARYIRAVYKPRDGERPLHDFPSGSLYKREYAAYLLSRSLGWPHVPITVIRDGPYGPGSLQLYVNSDPDLTYFDLINDNAEQLVRFAVFDLLANNADRKAGHCLLGSDKRIWSIDHGLTFHSIFKLRTVMLEFWGTPIPQPLLGDMEALAGHLDSQAGLTADLTELLTQQEIEALRRRLAAMLKDPVMPSLDPHHDVPWPLV